MRSRLLNKISAASPKKQEFIQTKYKLDDKTLAMVVGADPSDQGEYTEWVAKWVAKREIRLPEDTDKVNKQLTLFTKLKRSPAFKENNSPDINKYDPSQLYQATHEDVAQTNLSKKDQNREIIAKESEVILERDGWVLRRVYTIRAANLLGSNTNWCTAHPDYARNYLRKGWLVVFLKDGKAQAQWLPPNTLMDNTDKPLLGRTKTNQPPRVEDGPINVVDPDGFRSVFDEMIATKTTLGKKKPRPTTNKDENTVLASFESGKLSPTGMTKYINSRATTTKQRWLELEGVLVSKVAKGEDVYSTIGAYRKATGTTKDTWPELESAFLGWLNTTEDEILYSGIMSHYAKYVYNNKPWDAFEDWVESLPDKELSRIKSYLVHMYITSATTSSAKGGRHEFLDRVQSLLPFDMLSNIIDYLGRPLTPTMVDRLIDVLSTTDKELGSNTKRLIVVYMSDPTEGRIPVLDDIILGNVQRYVGYTDLNKHSVLLSYIQKTDNKRWRWLESEIVNLIQSGEGLVVRDSMVFIVGYVDAYMHTRWLDLEPYMSELVSYSKYDIAALTEYENTYLIPEGTSFKQIRDSSKHAMSDDELYTIALELLAETGPSKRDNRAQLLHKIHDRPTLVNTILEDVASGTIPLIPSYMNLSTLNYMGIPLEEVVRKMLDLGEFDAIIPYITSSFTGNDELFRAFVERAPKTLLTDSRIVKWMARHITNADTNEIKNMVYDTPSGKLDARDVIKTEVPKLLHSGKSDSPGALIIGYIKATSGDTSRNKDIERYLEDCFIDGHLADASLESVLGKYVSTRGSSFYVPKDWPVVIEYIQETPGDSRLPLWWAVGYIPDEDASKLSYAELKHSVEHDIKTRIPTLEKYIGKYPALLKKYVRNLRIEGYDVDKLFPEVKVSSIPGAFLDSFM